VSLDVRITPEGDSHVRLIGDAPHIGHPYRRSPMAGTRRVLLARTRYHVYDVPLDDKILVLAVWHARRGNGPPLRLG
jgi:plasmid stabilization system protein ParE